MQGSRFDALTRWTSRRFTRRTAITQAGTGLAAAFGLSSLGTRPVAAQVATPEPEASPVPVAPVSLLYVQYAGVTTLTPGTGDVHILTMTHVRPQTIYFSDRPNRISGAEPTASFVDGFADAFADSAPNATLIGHLENGAHDEEAVVLTLLSATYDEAAATLTYEVTLLAAELITDMSFEQEPLTVLDTAREYAEISLFIDSVTKTDDGRWPTSDACYDTGALCTVLNASCCQAGGFVLPEVWGTCLDRGGSLTCVIGDPFLSGESGEPVGRSRSLPSASGPQ